MANQADRDIAQRVHAALSTLNEEMAVANNAGLHVDINYITHETIGEHSPRRMYRAFIERREPI